MHPPIFVREPSDAERARLEAALRASDAFTVRRAQIVRASAEGRRPRAIARDRRCAVQTVRNGVRAFNAAGLAALTAGSSRPRSAAPVLGEAERERLRAILHQPPRAFGHPRSTWTLDLLAREAHRQGLSPAVLSGETIRQALLRLGVGWSGPSAGSPAPIPPTRKETSPRPSDRLGAGPAGLGLRLPGRGLVLPLRPAVPPRLGGGRRATPARRARRRSRAEGARPLRPVAAGAGADAAAVRGGAAGERHHPRLPRLGGRPPRRRGRPRPGPGLGQRPLARQPRGAGLDRGPQPPGQGRRARLPPPGLPPAEREPVAEPDRAPLGARQAGRGRARPQARRPGASATAVRSLPLPARRRASRTTPPLNLH